ncbi:AfsR/SARP family transcriptional regulator [Streptomyces sp. G-G2]|uniref:AfsR/SARP family transcriptional regulator n=1 Tax=Streptomyces sp. G-G2 TaxID=3046201 RepID=UPI0024B8D570|nr:AfsR/SARP family transcriptional regulator [Streptomyces sp. G-G2]MDJ0386146.1 AfsR/SARP family transcriptional regulator [Streptomyces sp. G-G2]
MEFLLLGPVEAHDPRTGARTAPSGAKQRALLGALAVHRGRDLCADRLIDELWGDAPPAAATGALQAHIGRLRRSLHALDGRDHIATGPAGYRLRGAARGTDAGAFELLSAEGRACLPTDPARAAELLRRSLDRWRGAPLEGAAGGRLCAAEADRLGELRLATQEALYEACLAMPHADHHALARELERLTADHPTQERLYDLLMVALYRGGRRSEALGVYERARRRLRTELGVEPGPALHARVTDVLESADPAAAALLGLRNEIARLSTRVDTLTRRLNSTGALTG